MPLLGKVLAPFSSASRNLELPGQEQEDALHKADDIAKELGARYNVNPFLFGSMATGLNVPGKYDYDYLVPVHEQGQFHQLVDKLKQDKQFHESKFNVPDKDLYTFKTKMQGTPVDFNIVFGPNADRRIEATKRIAADMQAHPDKRLDLIRQKAAVKDILPKIPGIGDSLVFNFKKHLDDEIGMPRIPRQDLGAAVAQMERSKESPLDSGALHAKTAAELSQHQLFGLRRSDVFGHRTRDLDPIIQSGRLMSAADAAKSGLLRSTEEAGANRGKRVDVEDVRGPREFRSEVFLTRGMLPANDDYGRYGVLLRSSKPQASSYLNTIPQEHVAEGALKGKFTYVVPDEEHDHWQAKYPDALFLRESHIPEVKRLGSTAGLGEIAGRLLSGPKFVQKKELVEMPKAAEVITPLLPHQQRVVNRMRDPNQSGLVVAHGLGSGKTLTSIAVQDALGMPASVVLPAALQANYDKERAKHLSGETQPIDMTTLQAVARRGKAPVAPMLIMDEAHRIRDASTKGSKAMLKAEAEKRLALTATPFYNAASDVAPLINFAAGQRVLPNDPREFYGKYVQEVPVNPTWWGRTFRGETPGLAEKVNPKTVPELRAAFGKYMDYHPSSAEGFPSVERRDVKIHMTPEQLKVYDTMLEAAPPWVAAKIKSGLPPSKQESKDLNAFMGAVRQVSNTTAAYAPEESPHQPKIEAAFRNLQRHLGENERAKAVVYSNYLDSGLKPYAGMLDQAKVPYGMFTGEMKQRDRDQMVRDYNEGKLRALLLSSAGGEGLDLKGTRVMQVLDPHWNEEKLHQVEGRGVRYGSHTDLPEEERKVMIERYLATRPRSGLLEKMHLKDPGGGVDEYLANLSGEKERLHEQFRQLIPGYVKSGPVKTAGSVFHGSGTKVQVLQPRHEHGLAGVGSVVFASPSRDFALAYAGNRWTNEDIRQGVVDGKRGDVMRLEEMRPGAFKDAFDTPGYLYRMSDRGFTAVSKDGTPEVVSSKAVKPTQVTHLRNVLKELKCSEDIELRPFREKTAALWHLLAGPVGHIAVNAAGRAAHHGSNLAEFMAHRGFQHGASGSAIAPLAARAVKAIAGPESTATYELARKAGKALYDMPPAHRQQAMQALSAGGQLVHPAMQHLRESPVLGDILRAVQHDVSGTVPQLKSKGFLAKMYSGAVDRMTRPTQTPFDSTGRKIVQNVVGGAPLAAMYASDSLGSAAHFGFNTAREALAKSSLGRHVMDQNFKKGLGGVPMSTGKQLLYDIGASPAFLDPYRVGLSANKAGFGEAVLRQVGDVPLAHLPAIVKGRANAFVGPQSNLLSHILPPGVGAPALIQKAASSYSTAKDGEHKLKIAELAEDEEHKLQGRLTFQGLPIAVENKKGSIRSGTTPDGHHWKTKMRADYGYLEVPAKGKDGEGIDVYVGLDKKAPNAYVVHQHKPDGTGHDEDKVLVGTSSMAEARRLYLKHYDDPKFLGPISEVPIEELKKKLDSKDRIEKISGAFLLLKESAVVQLSSRLTTKVKVPEDMLQSVDPAAAKVREEKGDHYVTLIRPEEVKRLRRQGHDAAFIRQVFSSVPKSDMMVKNEPFTYDTNRTLFHVLPVSWPKAQEARAQFGLKETPLHVTVGISPKPDTEIQWSMKFPKREHASLQGRLAEDKPIYTTRVSSERNKYRPGMLIKTPWGDKLKVETVEPINKLKDHPFHGELSDMNKKELGGKKMDLVKLVKAAK